MEYITNTITQIGKELSCDNDNGKIVVNKYDNKISKLIFSLDEGITGRKYIALLNPVTKKYYIEPIINSEVVITSKISAYPGKWKLLLIATDDDYEIEDNNIDQSKVTYVSNTFGRIIVRDNFLDESEIERVENPAIDEMLEALRIAQDRLENAAIVADEKASSTSTDREHVDEVKQSIDNIFAELQNIQETVKDNFSSIEDINSKIESNKKQVEDIAIDITQKASAIAEEYENIQKKLQDVQSSIPTRASQLENDAHYLEADGSISFGRKADTSVGVGSIACGLDVEASGQYSNAEGERTRATGQGAHAEGGAGTIASNKYAHGEGYGTTASGQAAHSEGYNTYATGNYSHASGYNSKATAGMATAQNYGTEANGQCSHAEGFVTVANQTATHAEGGGTIASSKYQHVQGKYNVEDTEGEYAHIVGGGSDANNRRNIHTVDWDGNAEYAGDVTVNYGGSAMQLGLMMQTLQTLLDNPYMHRNIFRGEYLGESITAEQLEAIRNGTFDGLYIGDYWEKGETKYRIADIDYWLYTGHPDKVNKHHIVIVPDVCLTIGKMSATKSTTDGYTGSLIKTQTLPELKTQLNTMFEEHIMERRDILNGWITTDIDLMSEIMLYGSNIYNQCATGTVVPNLHTTAKQQLSLFRLVPQYICADNAYWLRDITSSTDYALMSNVGNSGHDPANMEYGVRPVFAVG